MFLPRSCLVPTSVPTLSAPCQTPQVTKKAKTSAPAPDLDAKTTPLVDNIVQVIVNANLFKCDSKNLGDFFGKINAMTHQDLVYKPESQKFTDDEIHVMRDDHKETFPVNVVPQSKKTWIDEGFELFVTTSMFNSQMAEVVDSLIGLYQLYKEEDNLNPTNQERKQTLEKVLRNLIKGKYHIEKINQAL